MDIKTIRCSVCSTDLEWRFYNDIQELVIEPCSLCLENAEDKASKKSYDEAYQDGRDEGYSEGYDEAYQDGHEEGYSEGYDEGYSEGHDTMSEQEFKNGYKQGLEEGYTQGYDDGQKIAWNNTIVDPSFLN